MKHLKKYNESIDELDIDSFNIIFEDLINDKIVLGIKDNFNFFNKFFQDRKGSEGGVLVMLKAIPESNSIDNYLKEVDKYKEIMLDVNTCIKRIEDEFNGISHYIVTKKNNVNLDFDNAAFSMRNDMRETDIFLYFWYPSKNKVETWIR